MSIWAHVAGVIRYDALRLKGAWAPGTMAPWEWPETMTALARLPRGSEGPLTVQFWTNPHPTSLAAYAIYFHGDLRDVDDPAEVREWLARVTAGMVVRQGICEVEIERVGTYVYRVDDQAWVETFESAGVEPVTQRRRS